MHPMGVGFIIIGAACYGLGVFFFKMEKLKYNHLIWHLLVIAGSIFHWIAIYGYTLEFVSK
jgi:hemolysin III